MPGHPLARVNTDRCDLLAARPDSGVGGVTFSRNAEIGESVDQRFLDLSQVPVQVLTVSFKIHDRISDQLSGTMEGDISSALDFEQLDAFAP